jgi:hypothetical protein
MLNATQVDETFNAFGLGAPSPPIMSAITSVPDTYQAGADIIALPQVQQFVVPVMEMFLLSTGANEHGPTSATLSSIVSSDLTEPELATAFVSSQVFANNYNGGTLLNPNSPVSAGVVDALFLNGLGHAPTAATEADFAGMTNAQAFLAFASSPTTIAAETGEVDAVLIDIMKLAAGWPTDANIIGQSDAMHALAHGA